MIQVCFTIPKTGGVKKSVSVPLSFALRPQDRTTKSQAKLFACMTPDGIELRSKNDPISTDLNYAQKQKKMSGLFLAGW